MNLTRLKQSLELCDGVVAMPPFVAPVLKQDILRLVAVAEAAMEYVERRNDHRFDCNDRLSSMESLEASLTGVTR